MELIKNTLAAIIILLITIGTSTMVSSLFLHLDGPLLFWFNIVFGGLILGALSTYFPKGEVK